MITKNPPREVRHIACKYCGKEIDAEYGVCSEKCKMNGVMLTNRPDTALEVHVYSLVFSRTETMGDYLQKMK